MKKNNQWSKKLLALIKSYNKLKIRMMRVQIVNKIELNRKE